VNTGSRATCKSSWGVFDMVGNVNEWVEDWADRANNCTDWTTSAGIPGGDSSCFGGPGGAGVSSLPGALFRGGDFADGASAGVFAVDAAIVPRIRTTPPASGAPASHGIERAKRRKSHATGSERNCAGGAGAAGGRGWSRRPTERATQEVPRGRGGVGCRLQVLGSFAPSGSSFGIGFRCVR
jgi:hypothetical protein